MGAEGRGAVRACKALVRGLGMPLVVTASVADGQVLLVAAATFAQRADVLKGGVLRLHMFTAHPAWHFAMQLARHRFVNFVASER